MLNFTIIFIEVSWLILCTSLLDLWYYIHCHWFIACHYKLLEDFYDQEYMAKNIIANPNLQSVSVLGTFFLILTKQIYYFAHENGAVK